MILVTGAAGRLGMLVVDRLIARGYDVLATDRVPNDESTAPFLEADLCEIDRVSGLLDGAEAVIHMGAIPGPSRGEPRKIFENNVRSTYNLMTAAAEQELRRALGTQVRVVRARRGGRIEVQFTSEDELQRLYDRLTAR